MENKFEAKTKSDADKTYGIWNHDMQAFQFIKAWNGTETLHLEEAVNIAAQLNDTKAASDIPFFDMFIKHRDGSMDGYVLVINGCSYGNFSTIDDAKLWAVRWFMVLRPHIFGHSIMYRLHQQGSGSSHEWGNMVKTCKDENIEIPEGVEMIDVLNRSIGFKGQKV